MVVFYVPWTRTRYWESISIASCVSSLVKTSVLWLAQASALANAASRAQAGAVRREVLECSEELGRAVAGSVQEPVRDAFRECFEGQLIPRIQVSHGCMCRPVVPFARMMASGLFLSGP